MKKWFVITTINKPTKALMEITTLIKNHGWRCVVVGDKKTPNDWHLDGVDFLSLTTQHKRYRELSKMIPENHYSRKNIGYLYAIENGADLILETDDDNIPKANFGLDLNKQLDGDLIGGSPWVNVYKYFTDVNIWPRGNPLNTIHNKGFIFAGASVEAPIQQYLADGDPDVDAIFRLLFKDRNNFDCRKPIILDEKVWCSFNSQNTLFYEEAYPMLYLPCHVSFRMTDIWRSFVAQLALWSQGKRLAFLNATVVQDRNEHNLIRDFQDEIVGYLNNELISQELESLLVDLSSEDICVVVKKAWEVFLKLGLIIPKELEIYEAWEDQRKGLV